VNVKFISECKVVRDNMKSVVWKTCTCIL